MSFRKTARRKTAARLGADELFEHALRYLAMQACSTEQLRLKLRDRAATPPDLEAAIDRLKDVGYLNDERFAESYATNRVENDGFGRMRVLQDLRARRVPGGLAESAVERAFEGKDEAELIEAFLERRMPAVAGGMLQDERKLAAAYRRLRRAGFSSGGAIAALKRRAAQPELLDEPPPDEEAADPAGGY